MDEAAAKAAKARRRRELKDQKECCRRNGKVVAYERNGEYLDVEFTRNNGERVIGSYKLIGWVDGPAEEGAAIDASLREPPKQILWPGPVAERLRPVKQARKRQP